MKGIRGEKLKIHDLDTLRQIQDVKNFSYINDVICQEIAGTVCEFRQFHELHPEAFYVTGVSNNERNFYYFIPYDFIEENKTKLKDSFLNEVLAL